MSAILLILAFALPTIAGYAVVIALDKNRTTCLLERIPLSFAIGSGLLSLYMFLIGIAGAKYSIVTLSPFFIAALAFLAVRRAFLSTELLPRFNGDTSLTRLQTIAVVLIGAFTLWKIIFILHGASNYHAYFADAASTWNYKGKAIFYAKGIDGITSADVFGGTGAGYPLYNPLFRAWIAMMSGEWNETFVNLHSLALYISLITLFFCFLARYASLFHSLVFTYALTAIPLLTPHAFGSYAEISVTLFLFAALTSAAIWFDTDEDAYLRLSIIMLPFLVFTKNEGLLLYAPICVFTLGTFLYLKRKESGLELKTVCFTAAAALIACVIWIIAKITYSGGMGLSGMTIQFHAEAFGQIISILFSEGSFGLLFASCILLLALKPQNIKDKSFLVFASIAALALVATLAVFVFTSNYEWLRQRTTVNRTVLVTVPLILLCLGVFASRAFGRRAQKNSKRSL